MRNNPARHTRESSNQQPRRRRWLWASAVAAAAASLLIFDTVSDQSATATASPIEFQDVRAQTVEFMGFHDSITLTPEQEAIKKQALSAIPAPCCSDNTAYTCCCPCNMAKSWWGLANYLIAEEGRGAAQVQEAVEAWIQFINPDGFTGDVCYVGGGCSRPFHANGCGGMNENQIAF